MSSQRDLRSGYWGRSLVDLGIDMVRNVFFWAALAFLVVWIVLSVKVAKADTTPDEPLSKQEEAMLYAFMATGASLTLAGFTIYRSKNAQVRNLLDQAIPPLKVDVAPLQGSTYHFELITGDSLQKVVERAEDYGAMRRKFRLAKQKGTGDSPDEREVQKDLLEMYEKKVAVLGRKLEQASDEYHAPNIQLDYRLRIRNPDAYRVARIENLVVGFGSIPSIWSVKRVGFLDGSGNEMSFPLTLQPGEAVLGTYRCELRKTGTITAEKLGAYLNKKARASIPVQVAVYCDDTQGGVSQATHEQRMALSPLKDTLEEHWRSSKFYPGA